MFFHVSVILSCSCYLQEYAQPWREVCTVLSNKCVTSCVKGWTVLFMVVPLETCFPSSFHSPHPPSYACLVSYSVCVCACVCGCVGVWVCTQCSFMVLFLFSAFVCVCVRVRVCAHAHACVHACVRVLFLYICVPLLRSHNTTVTATQLS